MADITQLTSQLWTGGAIEDEADVLALVDAGITADIDLRRTDDRNSLGHDRPNAAGLLHDHPDIEYLHNPTADDGAAKPVSWFERSWNFAQPLMADGGVVLAHCMQGHNRGPSTAYFLLRAYYGMEPADAYNLITTARPVATLRYVPDADGAIIALDL